MPGSIAEAGYRRLGGLDQWVMIRGESVANPALIMLHGGPGLVGQFSADLDDLVELVRAAPALEMPVCFFLGRNDHWVPPEASLASIHTLIAPSKEVNWFERSGHEPFADEPARCNAAMVDLMRPQVVPQPREMRLAS